MNITDMKNAILQEKFLHPLALPQDYIKLIFQSEFGPGHLIADGDMAKKRLWDEWERVKDLDFEPRQDIGGGYIRFNIKGIDKKELENINIAFVTSANNKTGTDTGFIYKINLLLQMAQEGMLSFDYEDAKQAVDVYLAGGIRPTSHTQVYHMHYTPAYRVVKGDLLNKP